MNPHDTTPTPAQQLEEVRQARDLAMHYAAAAPVPLCGDFARIAQSLDAAMPMMEHALAALEAVEKMKRELPRRVESLAFGDLNAEELSIFDNGYNAALLLSHNLLAASGLDNGGGDDVDANFGARLVAAPPADAVEVSRG